MKNLLIVLVSVFSVLPAFGDDSPLEVTPDTVIDMSIDKPSATFTAAYPGLGKDHVCSVELRLHPQVFASIQWVNMILTVEEINIGEVLPIKVGHRKGIIQIPLDKYITTFTISTRNGRTLREALGEIGLHQGYLQLHGVACSANK